MWFETGTGTRKENTPERLRKPHDAQVRRISWVRGVGRPALAHSGLLVPLPTADRPPSFIDSGMKVIPLNGIDKMPSPGSQEVPETKTPPDGGVSCLQ
jgi:hypothetical protein